MYTTYAIIEPITRLFVYVDQTNNFERRKAEHLSPPRTRKTLYRKSDIKGWLTKAHVEKITPGFIVLEVVETEEQSILSEKQWVEKLAAIRMPLLILWPQPGSGARIRA